MKRLFCFGIGFTARTLIDLLRRDKGWCFAGTRRNGRGPGDPDDITILPFRDNLPLIAEDLVDTTHLLLSIPPGSHGDLAWHHHHEDIASLVPKLQWLGYISTTGVYGDREGAEVDETSPPYPMSETAKARLLAEQAWSELGQQINIPVYIFRFAGIYGPGRNIFIRLRMGTARRIDQPGVKVARIHVKDGAAVLRAAIASPHKAGIYNVCDDTPTEPHELVTYASELLRISPPPLEPFDQANLDPRMARFYLERRYVLNQRIKKDLGITLLYPSYREGLAALLEDERMRSL